jgi:hypothetical protein
MPQSMHGGAGEGVVVVMPGLAQRGQGEPGDVGRAIVGVEPSPAEEVAHRVDAPGDVMDEEHPHQATPEQAGQGARDSTADEEARDSREQEAGDRDRDEAALISRR